MVVIALIPVTFRYPFPGASQDAQPFLPAPALFGAWLGGLPYWATTGNVLDWCREHNVEPKWLQWLPSKMGAEATLYSCLVFFDTKSSGMLLCKACRTASMVGE